MGGMTRHLVVAASLLLLPVVGCQKPRDEAATPPPQPTEPPKPVLTAPPAPTEPPGLPAPSDVAAPPADAEKTPSGLVSRVLTKGTGKEHPGADNMVEVNYSGWTTDGKMFDSSIMRGRPAEFPVGGVIKGWTEGLQLMVVGDKMRFWIPGPMAY